MTSKTEQWSNPVLENPSASEGAGLDSDRAVSSLQWESWAAVDIAARSLVDTQAIHGSVENVVAVTAIDYNFASLFQYCAIRVGAEKAEEILERLASELAQKSRERSGTRMGQRRILYSRARALVRESAHASEQTGQRLPPPPWWQPEDATYRQGLNTLRHELRLVAEAAELRFARRLEVAEIASVMESDERAVRQACESAIDLATRRLGKRPNSHDRTPQGALLEVFALNARLTRSARRRGRRPVLSMGAIIASRYEIEALLGSGAFSDVYRARDQDVVGRVVALKILRAASPDERSVGTALRELQLIASVFHPSVVQLKDHGWHDGHLWFVMPLYRGETLATRLRRGPLSRREAREIFEPLAEALATMHWVGVLHQDIKPENIFLADIDPGENTSGKQGKVLPVLLDLGVAAKDAELVLAGTPAYFAPEVAARFSGVPDPAPVGPKADVFSLALSLRDALNESNLSEIPLASVDAFVAYRARTPPVLPRSQALKDLRPWFERWLHLSPDPRPDAEQFGRQLAVLTMPEERAARRAAFLRWAVPSAIALMALFGSIVFALSREAHLQRLEAMQAREVAERARRRAETINATLNAQQAYRRQLEADVTRLERQYHTSRMTREQLAERLAQAEAELGVLVERQAQHLRQAQERSADLQKLRTQHDALAFEVQQAQIRDKEQSGKLEKARIQLEGERQRRENEEAARSRLEQQLADVRAQLVLARGRVAEFEARLALLKPGADTSPRNASRPTTFAISNDARSKKAGHRKGGL